jgi:hypothetical protein
MLLTNEGDKMRRDKCKCGKFITWDEGKDSEVKCKHCKTEYRVDCDSVLLYWLEEKIEKRQPYRTNPR